jgi:DNA-binding NarL/FixJ family response regulator
MGSCQRSKSNQLPILGSYPLSSLLAALDERAGGPVDQVDYDRGVGLLALIARTVSYLHRHLLVALHAHPAGSPDASDQALEAISTQAALALLSVPPREQAEIILLRVVAGLSVEDVARMVGKKPGAVRVAAHRALRRLAAMVDRADVTA